jgi:tetratricopeptide (TPR) repeat protein
MAILYTKQGEYELARHQLSSCITLAGDQGLSRVLVAAQSTAADLELRQGQAEAAIPLLVAAQELAQEIGATDKLAEIACGFAQAHLALGQPMMARKLAERALTLARASSMRLEEGTSQRLWGQIWQASGERQQALAAFEQSFSLLDEYDPYEAARTQVQWGLALIATDETEQGLNLLQTARTRFMELGAKGDLADLDLPEAVAPSGGDL